MLPTIRPSNSLRTDQTLRIHKAAGKLEPACARLTPCPTGHLSFACSPEHWALAKTLHSFITCPDSPFGLSQCQINSLIFADAAFETLPEQLNSRVPFQWAPNRTVEQWSSVLNPGNSNWETEFGELAEKELGMSGPRPDGVDVNTKLRVASEGLSMTMTILWAFEKLNGGDDAWTRRETLEVHVSRSFPS